MDREFIQRRFRRQAIWPDHPRWFWPCGYEDVVENRSQPQDQNVQQVCDAWCEIVKVSIDAVEHSLKRGPDGSFADDDIAK